MTQISVAPGRMARFDHRAFAWAIDAIPYVVVPYLATRLSGSVLVGLAAFLVVGILWSMLPEARAGMTIGKRLLGICVVDAEAGSAGIGLPRAARRWAVKYLVEGILPIGYLWYYRDPTRRAWHDHAAGTVVVDLVSPG